MCVLFLDMRGMAGLVCAGKWWKYVYVGLKWVVLGLCLGGRANLFKYARKG